MIPKFPKFKKLEASDRTEVEIFTSKFPPYSDFNFTSLWCYDTQDQIHISDLNNNLVVKFTDYQTLELFYSFIGINKVDETATDLLNLAKFEKIITELKLLPLETVNLLNQDIFNIKEDLDNFDYVLSNENLKTYSGKKLGPKRNFVNRFKKNYNSHFKKIDLFDKKNQEDIHALCISRAADNEFKAISRIFSLNHPKILTVGVYVNEKLVGFTINEILNHEYAILHFEKGDTDSYIGLFPALMQETSKILSDEKISFLNYEQDLGIPGLRQSKQSYYPAHYLKQFIVSFKKS